MKDKALTLTNARIRALDKRLQGIYSAAYKTAVERERAAIAKLATFDTDELRRQGFSDTAIRAKKLAHKARVLRETKLVNTIAAELSNAGKIAAGIVKDEMTNIYGINLDWSRYSVDMDTGVMFNWQIYDKRQLNVLLESGQSPFTKIAYNNLGKNSVITRRLQNALTQSVLLGESQQQINKRIREVTGQSVKQARRVTQTERNRVQSQARHKGIEEAAEMGVEMQKQWISRMDDNVRDDHVMISGEVVDYNEAFSNGLMYPGDPDGAAEEVINCRCVLKSMVKNVPDSVKRHRAEIEKKHKFEEWRTMRELTKTDSSI